MIPIFDSLAHPTLSGTWTEKHPDAAFETLLEQMDQAGFPLACAIGIAGKAEYNHKDFAKACSKYPQLVPVAGFDPIREKAATVFPQLVDLGYTGIKIHPRYSNIDVHHQIPALVETLQQAAHHGLVVFWCTYYQTQLPNFPTTDPFFDLVSILKESPETRVLLVHGGGIRAMEYAELVRFNPNLLLDLSLTLMKYPKSSVDSDLQFLFNQFDQRICLGSDFPEYSLQEIRKKTEQLSTNLATEKLKNICYRNLAKFLSIDFPEPT